MDNLETFPTLNAKALIVEDDVAWLKYFNHIVSKDNGFFDFTHVNDLKSAIELIKNNSYQLILLDLSLPDSSGVNTIKQIIEVSKSVPIVVLTSTDDATMVEDSMQMGIEDYLIKGNYDEKLFFHVVHQAMRRYIAKNDSIQFVIKKLNELENNINQIKEIVKG